MYFNVALVLTLLIAFPFQVSAGFWPYKVNAAPGTSTQVYANTNAKRIAIIGMRNFVYNPLPQKCFFD